MIKYSKLLDIDLIRRIVADKTRSEAWEELLGRYEYLIWIVFLKAVGSDSRIAAGLGRGPNASGRERGDIYGDFLAYFFLNLREKKKLEALIRKYRLDEENGKIDAYGGSNSWCRRYFGKIVRSSSYDYRDKLYPSIKEKTKKYTYDEIWAEIEKELQARDGKATAERSYKARTISFGKIEELKDRDRRNFFKKELEYTSASPQQRIDRKHATDTAMKFLMDLKPANRITFWIAVLADFMPLPREDIEWLADERGMAPSEIRALIENAQDNCDRKDRSCHSEDVGRIMGIASGCADTRISRIFSVLRKISAEENNSYED